MQDLLDRIQASEEELMSHLETIHACQIDGKYFLFLHNNSMLMNWTFFTKILSPVSRILADAGI